VKDFVIDLRDLEWSRANKGGEEEEESEAAWMLKKSGSGGGVAEESGEARNSPAKVYRMRILYSCAKHWS
jgi:hypothetical protein